MVLSEGFILKLFYISHNSYTNLSTIEESELLLSYDVKFPSYVFFIRCGSSSFPYIGFMIILVIVNIFAIAFVLFILLVLLLLFLFLWFCFLVVFNTERFCSRFYYLTAEILVLFLSVIWWVSAGKLQNKFSVICLGWFKIWKLKRWWKFWCLVFVYEGYTVTTFSTILKTSKNVYVKVCIFWRSIQYTIHWDKTQMLKIVP